MIDKTSHVGCAPLFFFLVVFGHLAYKSNKASTEYQYQLLGANMPSLCRVNVI